LNHIDFQKILKDLKHLRPEELSALLASLRQLEQAESKEAARNHFLPFVKKMWPAFIEGPHHRIMADSFERLVEGKLPRIGIHLAPRFGKSQLASWLLPAWFIGKYPDKKLIMASHTADLSVDWGKKVRNLIGTPEYQEVFPGVALSSDSKAAGHWRTNKGGEYYAVGVGGALAGRGGDLVVIDDAVSEQEAISGDPKVYEKVWDWYLNGPRQRLQPGGRICHVCTRWSKVDLAGRLYSAMESDPAVDQWEVINFPALMPDGSSLWPEYWPAHTLEQIKAVQPTHRWLSVYQQNPTSEEGSVVRKEWWKEWPADKALPVCDYTIQCWDTAYDKTSRANPSACVSWGVFWHKEGAKRHMNVILLDAFAERMSFPQLKEKAFRRYMELLPGQKERSAAVIVETRATGLPLIWEMRERGIPVQEYTPSRGADKMVRVNSVADLFQAGAIWAPATRWADEVIAQYSDFPNGEFDDLVDAATMGLRRLREGGFINLATDYTDEDETPRKKVFAYY